MADVLCAALNPEVRKGFREGAGYAGIKGRQGYLKNKWIVAGSILLSIMVLLAVFVPLVSEWSYTEQNAAARNLLPSAEHWFGTDKFGRDIFVRVWYGTRISLEVGIMSAFSME